MFEVVLRARRLNMLSNVSAARGIRAKTTFILQRDLRC